MEKASLSAQAMCNRIAMEFEDGWAVNLGAGMATMCADYDFKDRTIIFHSENGILGYGPPAPKGKEDFHLTNASNTYTTLLSGAAIVHHGDSFALIRGGHLDAVVMGAYEVAENGDLANWKIAGRRGGGIGGAMDLAVGAKRVFIVMEHTTRDGQPRLRKRCRLPLTAAGVVDLVVTNLGVFDVTRTGFVLREMAPGYTPEEIQAVSEAKLRVPDDITEFQVDL
jgi:3-oxoacid CoA-transferase B subunit